MSIAEEDRRLREGRNIAEVPVRNHRETEDQDDAYFHHHHRAGDFKQQLFSTGGDSDQYGENRHFIEDGLREIGIGQTEGFNVRRAVENHG